MPIYVAGKVAGALIVLLCAFLGCIVEVPEAFAQTAHAFTGGVFLSIALVHMMADALEAINGDVLAVLSCVGAGFILVMIVHGWRKHTSDIILIPLADLDPRTSQSISNSASASPVVSEEKLPGVSANVLILALSFHSLLAGLAVGASSYTSTGRLVLILIAIGAHKFLAAFALASSLPVNASRVVLLLFSLVTPVAMMVGLTFSVLTPSNSIDTLTAILLSLASGTFLYVATVEILPINVMLIEDKTIKRRNLVAVVVGYTLMSILAVWA